MTHMVDVVEYEQIACNTGYINPERHFDVLLECGHLQEITTSMPTPPLRVMCRECIDAESAGNYAK